MRGPRTRPATLRAIERVKAGETPAAVAKAEGITATGLYAALARQGIDIWALRDETRQKQAIAQARAQAERKAEESRREDARLLVRAAGKPLLRGIIDRAESMLSDGVARPDIIAMLVGASKPRLVEGAGERATYRALVAEVEELRETVRQLRAELHHTGWTAPEALKLTPLEEGVVRLLLGRETGVTKVQIMDALYSLSPDSDEPQIRIVDVFICKIRAKLKPHDIAIETMWGRGYRMPAESRARLRATETKAA